MKPVLVVPFQAIGFCYPFTFQTTLAALLTNRSNVTVEQAGMTCPYFVYQSV